MSLRRLNEMASIQSVGRDQLRGGTPLFLVTFLDKDLYIPLIETVFFVDFASDQSGNDGKLAIFQLADSYLSGESIESAAKDGKLLSKSVDELSNLYAQLELSQLLSAAARDN